MSESLGIVRNLSYKYGKTKQQISPITLKCLFFFPCNDVLFL